MISRKFSDVEKSILWHLVKRSRPTTSRVAITGYEEISGRFPLDEITTAWDRLKGEGLVQGEVNGGGIGPVPAYKNLKRMFWFRLLCYKSALVLRNVGRLILKYFWLAIIAPVAVGVLVWFITSNLDFQSEKYIDPETLKILQETPQETPTVPNTSSTEPE